MIRQPGQSLEDYGRNLYAQVRQENAANHDQQAGARPDAAASMAQVAIECTVEAVGSAICDVISACTE